MANNVLSTRPKLENVSNQPDSVKKVIRAKGILWLATEAGHALQGIASLAGRNFAVNPGAPWWAQVDKCDWPKGLETAIKPLWHEPYGDRQNELVVIGHDMDEKAVRQELDACLVTPEEFEAGIELWTSYEDPFKSDWDRELGIALEEHDHSECGHDHGHA